MFKVIHKLTDEVRTVYGRNGSYFLFWNSYCKCWEYDDMDNYRPAEV